MTLSYSELSCWTASALMACNAFSIFSICVVQLLIS